MPEPITDEFLATWRKVFDNLESNKIERATMDIVDLRSFIALIDQLRASEERLPPTFYAELPLPDRITRMTEIWNRAVAAVAVAEASLKEVQRHLSMHCYEDHRSESCHRPGRCLDCDWTKWTDKQLLADLKPFIRWTATARPGEEQK